MNAPDWTGEALAEGEGVKSNEVGEGDGTATLCPEAWYAM